MEGPNKGERLLGVVGGRAKERERETLFRVERTKSDKEEDCSKWNGKTTETSGRAKEREKEDCSRWKGQRQRKRKIVPGGSDKDRERGRLFLVEGPKTEEEEDYSRWKEQSQRKGAVGR